MNLRHRTKAVAPIFRLLALCMLVFVALGAASKTVRAQSANSLYKQGEAAESRDDVDAAYEKFNQAFQKNPQDLRYRTAYYRVRFSAAALHTKRGVALREKGDYSAALTEFLHALEIDPSNELARQEIEATREKMKTSAGGESSIPRSAASELSEVASPIVLKPISNEPITLHMSEDSKVVYQTIGKASGINVLFDPEYTSKRIQIDLSNVSLYDALRIMGAVSGTFWRAVTSNTIFVAANTRAKRTELDEQAVQTFYLTNASQANDLNDIQTALRNVLANAKLYGVPSQNAIVMRGTPDELLLASKLIDDLDKARPEVVVDVAVLEVSRDKMRNIGISLPGTASVSLQPATSTTASTPTTPGTTTTSTNGLTLNDLSSLNATNFAVTIGQATANLLLSDTNTKILQNPRIRASDNQKATMKIGSRIPIATGSFSSGAATALASSLVNTQFQYLDVGVNIDMTPVVHYDRDVTLKLKIEVSSQNGSVTISGVTEPIISQRTIEQVIRLREGEANILGGILTKQDSRAISGTPGLGELPFLKYLFSNNQHDVQQDEIVFLLIPHVVRATQLSLLNTRQIDTGTGTTVEIRHLAAVLPAAPVAGLAATDTSVAQSPAPPQMQPGAAIPGQSAAGAAANAIAAGSQAGGLPNGAAGGTPGTMPVALQLVPATGTQKVGSTFQIAVNLSGGKDIVSVPMQVAFDPNKLTLINVDSGGFLGHDGQAVALVHRDDGVGNVTVSASRPPGVAGVEGAGTVCIFTFQAKAAGDAIINITKPGARNSAQQPIDAVGSQALVHVQ